MFKEMMSDSPDQVDLQQIARTGLPVPGTDRRTRIWSSWASASWHTAQTWCWRDPTKSERYKIDWPRPCRDWAFLQSSRGCGPRFGPGSPWDPWSWLLPPGGSWSCRSCCVERLGQAERRRGENHRSAPCNSALPMMDKDIQTHFRISMNMPSSTVAKSCLYRPSFHYVFFSVYFRLFILSRMNMILSLIFHLPLHHLHHHLIISVTITIDIV